MDKNGFFKAYARNKDFGPPYDFFGVPIPDSSSWLIAGSHFDQLIAVQLPVDCRLRMSAMEQADRKFRLPQPRQSCRLLHTRV